MKLQKIFIQFRFRSKKFRKSRKPKIRIEIGKNELKKISFGFSPPNINYQNNTTEKQSKNK